SHSTCSSIFFFNAPATTDIYTLSLHDALPILAQKLSQISGVGLVSISGGQRPAVRLQVNPEALAAHQLSMSNVRQAVTAANVNQDRKSTRLNSSHVKISYAVFCLKKKKKKISR